MDFIYFLLGFFIINLIFIAAFARIYREMDHRKFKKEKMQNEDPNGSGSHLVVDRTSLKNSIKEFLYGILQHYGYAWARLNFLILSRFPSNRIRNIIFRYIYCANITKNTVINGGVEIRSPWNLVADRCIIMSGCILDARHGISIGEDVVFGTGVHIWTEEHDLNDPYFAVNKEHAKPVEIGEHAWICSDSTILPGIKVGEGAVVASRACVVKDCCAFGVYGGVPAKYVSERSHDLRYRLSNKPHWHFY